MLRLFPTVQDLRCLFAFIFVSALSYLFSYFFIMGRSSDARIDHMQASVLLYGSTQSLIGFVGGFYMAKLMYFYPRSEYAPVKSDDYDDGMVVALN